MRKQNSKQNKKPNTRNSNKKDYKTRTAKTMDDKTQMTEDFKKSSNDVAWYAADKQILNDAASIPFSYAAGMPISRGDWLTAYFPKETVAPGVCAYLLKPTFGLSQDSTSPINVAANSLYTWIRAFNSGHANYDAPDLMVYVVALSSVYSYINYLTRLYGIAQLYTQQNRYLPDALIKICGADPSDIQTNLSDFRYGINVLINKASSFCVPANMTWFNRAAFLYQNYYIEGTSIKDQIYLTVPASFFRFDPTGIGSSLRDIFFTNLRGDTLGKKKVADLLQYGEDLLKPLLGNEDVHIMSGDILKAYGQANVMQLAALPVDYIQAPAFNIQFLEQLKNATVFNGWDLYNFDLVQNSTGALIFDPFANVYASSFNYDKVFAHSAAEYMSSNKILTTTTEFTSPELVMENSRLMASGTVVRTKDVGVEDADELHYRLMHLITGSEIVAECRIFTLPSVQMQGALQQWGANNPIKNGLLGSWVGGCLLAFGSPYSNEALPNSQQLNYTIYDIRVVMASMARAATFKFVPNTYIMYSPGNLKAQDIDPGFITYDNYAILSRSDLKAIHYAAIINMLHVPYLNKVLTN